MATHTGSDPDPAIRSRESDELRRADLRRRIRAAPRHRPVRARRVSITVLLGADAAVRDRPDVDGR